MAAHAATVPLPRTCTLTNITILHHTAVDMLPVNATITKFELDHIGREGLPE